MDRDVIVRRIDDHLRELVEAIGPRPPGSPANRRATDYLRRVVSAAGLDVSEQPFDCRWWEPGPAAIRIGGEWLAVPPAPFSRPAEVAGRVARIGTGPALETATIDAGRVVVIDGDLTAEPYFPKAFPFLDLPDQRSRIARLEALRPAAVIAVSEIDGPYAMFEDPDLAFPYVVVQPALAGRLHDGAEVAIRIGGAIHEGSAVNLSARHGHGGDRIVISAHVDSKVTTPGALDNAGGVSVLLALAEASLPADPAIEFVFFNGEDHYAAPGEQAWLAEADLATIIQVVNVDGAGAVGHGTSIAALACPAKLELRVAAAVDGRDGWSVAPPWYESDHAMFAMRGIPSLAITSAGDRDWLGRITHTDRDTRAMVDPVVLADVAAFVADWIRGSGRATTPMT